MKITEVTTTDIITELSTELLGKYKSAAGASASAADKRGDTATGNKRFSGIVKATKKQFANDAKKHVAENNEESEFANELYELLEQHYPKLVARAGAHAMGNAVADFMNYKGLVEPAALVHEVAKAIKQSLTAAEF